MFGTKRKQKRIRELELQLELQALQMELQRMDITRMRQLLIKAENLLARCRCHQVDVVPAAFSNDEIRKLLQLCHPDKHNNSPLAAQMTSKLLQLRR